MTWEELLRPLSAEELEKIVPMSEEEIERLLEEGRKECQAEYDCRGMFPGHYV